ncbi:hypothetical protein [Mycobacterium sp. 94-17]|nr:hypothetical protein [Mycobacterium sp. 94-17]MEB4208805.1 hypothetical protein [Mycobacterium sp. 94-17]
MAGEVDRQATPEELGGKLSHAIAEARPLRDDGDDDDEDDGVDDE